MALDEHELERIYRRCHARAMGLAMSLLHDAEEARDVVQEVFARLLEGGSAKPWTPAEWVTKISYFSFLSPPLRQRREQSARNRVFL